LESREEAMRQDEIMTEVRRMARNAVKDELKRQGIKLSGVEASAITKAANYLIKVNPKLIAAAKRDLKRRAKAKVKVSKIPPKRRKR
jgi:hypothetical protein